MGEWRECKLSDIIELIGGGTPKTTTPDYWDGDIPWLSITDFNNGRKFVSKTEKYITTAGLENSSTKLLNTGDIIISARGTVGVIAVLVKPMTFNQSCYGVRAVDGMAYNNYIYYLLKDTVSSLQQIAHGGVFDTITRETFNNIDILLPPIPEQKAIAEVLSSLDDKVDLLHRQNKTLEAMAETLFRQWFVEFDFPGFTGELVDGIPKGWLVLDLSSVSTLIAGGDKPTKYSIQQNELYKIPIYSNSITDEGLYGFTDLPRVYEESVTVSARGTIGYVCLRVKPFVPIVRLITVIPNQKYVSAKYIYLWLKNENISGTGTTQQQLTVPDFKKSKILVPHIEQVNQFTLIVNSIFDKIEHNISQSRSLEKLRNTLLPKLMSGEVRVKL